MTPVAGTAPGSATTPERDTTRDGAVLRERAQQIRRALHDLGNGTNFQLPDDADGGTLDPIPLEVPAAEWARVGRALEQRAMVLELILDDLFGPQRLLAGGHLPTEAILAHREYLRQCVGIASPGAHRLVLYAADIARSTSGAYSVLADRTQMPAGIGNAVQNREVMARVSPEALDDRDVAPIEDWLSTCRAALGALARTDVDQPRIVMMTPGAAHSPHAHTHTEHAYLARTLGFTLVEPGDLTVRDASVFLKSVSGLEPVHVIVRLVPSPLCDPLELDGDSMLGVAGLVEACRRDRVAVANPLGSGVGECAALLPFLPRLTRTLLDEEPMIESAPTWWCGDPAGLSHVVANLDRLLIRSLDVGADGRHTTFGRLLSQSQRDELLARVAAAPHRFVGQEEVDIEASPSFTGAAVVDRPTISRAFLVRDQGGYRCMEGALTLTDDRAEAITFASYRTSKDSWVCGASALDSTAASTRAPAPSTPTRSGPLAPVDLRGSITSRAAESMFWIGRNLERAQAVIRLVRAIGLMNETRHDLRDHDPSWATTVDRFVTTLAGIGDSADTPPEGLGTTDLLVAAVVDRKRARSLATSLHFLLTNADGVRELFSADSWRLLSQVGEHRLQLSYVDHDQVAEVATSAITPLLALSGLIGDSMVRDPGWRFLDLGRRIESASLMAMSLGSALSDELPAELGPPFLEATLHTWDGLVAYRRRYRSDVDPALLIDLLVTDDSNPRSIRSQLCALVTDIEELPGAESRRAEILSTAAVLRDLISAADPVQLAAVDGYRRRHGVATLASTVRTTLDALATEIDLTYFVQVRSSSLYADLPSEPGADVSELVS